MLRIKHPGSSLLLNTYCVSWSSQGRRPQSGLRELVKEETSVTVPAPTKRAGVAGEEAGWGSELQRQGDRTEGLSRRAGGALGPGGCGPLLVLCLLLPCPPNRLTRGAGDPVV